VFGERKQRENAATTTTVCGRIERKTDLNTKKLTAVVVVRATVVTDVRRGTVL